MASSKVSSSPSVDVTIGRVCLTFVGLVTSIGCYIADFNHTHVYNEEWPPHARFHNGQTMSMGLLLGLLTLYYTWRPSYDRDSLLSACIIGALYWITQLSSILYPGTAWVDPLPGQSAEDVRGQQTILTAPQPKICLTMFVCVAVAWWREGQRLDALGSKAKVA